MDERAQLDNEIAALEKMLADKKEARELLDIPAATFGNNVCLSCEG